MPVRLTVNETSLSGSSYDDVVGVRYEFPSQYRRIILPGRRFVYYRGRRTKAGGSQPPAYLGVGVIGEVRVSAQAADRFVCDIDDYRQFPEPVFFKDSSGDYYEPGATGGFYWQQGVKDIPDSAYERIVAASVPLPAPDDQRRGGHHGYGSPERAAEIDDYAMTAALVELARMWPGTEIARQPHNNPGFDVRVGPVDNVVRYVEVKGTSLPRPSFFLSEGERQFSELNASKYTLLVIHSIDVDGRHHEVFRHDGPIAQNAFLLSPRQWQCEAKADPS
jgi:hypothetical protein